MLRNDNFGLQKDFKYRFYYLYDLLSANVERLKTTSLIELRQFLY